MYGVMPILVRSYANKSMRACTDRQHVGVYRGAALSAIACVYMLRGPIAMCGAALSAIACVYVLRGPIAM